jgi:copper/silver efflux system protein
MNIADVADILINDGPPMLRSDNARLSGYVYIDLLGRDLQTAVKEIQESVESLA